MPTEELGKEIRSMPTEELKRYFGKNVSDTRMTHMYIERDFETPCDLVRLVRLVRSRPFFGECFRKMDNAQLQRQAGWRHAPAVGGCGQPSTIVMEVQLKDSHKLIATSKKKSYYLLEPWQSSGHI